MDKVRLEVIIERKAGHTPKVGMVASRIIESMRLAKVKVVEARKVRYRDICIKSTTGHKISADREFR